MQGSGDTRLDLGNRGTKIPRRDKGGLGCQRNSREARAGVVRRGGGQWEVQPGEQTRRAIVTQSLVGSSGKNWKL